MPQLYFGITDMGNVRSNNEDAFIAQALPGKDLLLACAIDGVGGYEGGEVAAQLTHTAILELLNKPFAHSIEALKTSLHAANTAIYQEKITTKTNQEMACVVSLALVDLVQHKFYYVHIGDTRIYLLRDHTLVKISHDHSFVGFLEDAGKLTEHEAIKHPRRNEINKALGFEAELPADDIETGESPFLPGDMLMLCTDGLTDMLDRSAMTTILTTQESIEAKAKSLITAANHAGGKDNVTVVLVENPTPHIPLKRERSVTDSLFAEEKKGEVNKIASDEKHLAERKNFSTKELSSPAKKGGIGWFFKLLFVLITVALGWNVYRYYYNNYQHEHEPPDVAIRVRNQQEQVFLDSIAHTATGEVFVINTPGSLPLAITDTVKINNDTLHIIGNGVTIVADSFYKGPAFVLSKNCKSIILDSLTLQGFEVGVIANNQALELRNVQFKDCHAQVVLNEW